MKVYSTRHDTLLQKMAERHLPDNIYNWMVNFFSVCFHCMRYVFATSTWDFYFFSVNIMYKVVFTLIIRNVKVIEYLDVGELFSYITKNRVHGSNGELFYMNP